MALPASAPKVPCTLSRPLQGEGTEGEIASAYLTVDRTLIWAASGETIYGNAVPIYPDNVDGTLLFEVIPVDAAGVFDAAANMVTNWLYTLNVVHNLSDGQQKIVKYDFQPHEGQTELDLDLVAQQGAVSDPPATISGEEVIVQIVNVDTISGGTP